MPTRLHIAALLVVAIGYWIVVLLIRGTAITSEHLWPFGTVVSATAVTLGLFNKYAWRWKIFRGWLVTQPDLQGTWQATLESEWTDPTTGSKPQPIECYMVVRQTFTMLSMRLMTSESSSWLVAHKIYRSDDDVYFVATVYMNQPNLQLRGDRSEIHYGAFLLQIIGYPPMRLEGHYWTDRNTRGTLRLSDRIAMIHETFDSARDAFLEQVRAA